MDDSEADGVERLRQLYEATCAAGGDGSDQLDLAGLGRLWDTLGFARLPHKHDEEIAQLFFVLDSDQDDLITFDDVLQNLRTILEWTTRGQQQAPPSRSRGGSSRRDNGSGRDNYLHKRHSSSDSAPGSVGNSSPPRDMRHPRPEEVFQQEAEKSVVQAIWDTLEKDEFGNLHVDTLAEVFRGADLPPPVDIAGDTITFEEFEAAFNEAAVGAEKPVVTTPQARRRRMMMEATTPGDRPRAGSVTSSPMILAAGTAVQGQLIGDLKTKLKDAEEEIAHLRSMVQQRDASIQRSATEAEEQILSLSVQLDHANTSWATKLKDELAQLELVKDDEMYELRALLQVAQSESRQHREQVKQKELLIKALQDDYDQQLADHSQRNMQLLRELEALQAHLEEVTKSGSPDSGSRSNRQSFGATQQLIDELDEANRKCQDLQDANDELREQLRLTQRDKHDTMYESSESLASEFSQVEEQEQREREQQKLRSKLESLQHQLKQLQAENEQLKGKQQAAADEITELALQKHALELSLEMREKELANAKQQQGAAVDSAALKKLEAELAKSNNELRDAQAEIRRLHDLQEAHKELQRQRMRDVEELNRELRTAFEDLQAYFGKDHLVTIRENQTLRKMFTELQHKYDKSERKLLKATKAEQQIRKNHEEAKLYGVEMERTYETAKLRLQSMELQVGEMQSSAVHAESVHKTMVEALEGQVRQLQREIELLNANVAAHSASSSPTRAVKRDNSSGDPIVQEELRAAQLENAVLKKQAAELQLELNTSTATRQAEVNSLLELVKKHEATAMESWATEKQLKARLREETEQSQSKHRKAQAEHAAELARAAKKIAQLEARVSELEKLLEKQREAAAVQQEVALPAARLFQGSATPGKEVPMSSTMVASGGLRAGTSASVAGRSVAADNRPANTRLRKLGSGEDDGLPSISRLPHHPGLEALRSSTPVSVTSSRSAPVLSQSQRSSGGGSTGRHGDRLSALQNASRRVRQTLQDGSHSGDRTLLGNGSHQHHQHHHHNQHPLQRQHHTIDTISNVSAHHSGSSRSRPSRRGDSRSPFLSLEQAETGKLAALRGLNQTLSRVLSNDVDRHSDAGSSSAADDNYFGDGNEAASVNTFGDFHDDNGSSSSSNRDKDQLVALCNGKLGLLQQLNQSLSEMSPSHRRP